jgi:hypothetical protein
MLLFVQTFAVVVLNNICGQLISLFISIIFVVIERKLIVQMYELTLNKLKNKLKRVKNNENKEII